MSYNITSGVRQPFKVYPGDLTIHSFVSSNDDVIFAASVKENQNSYLGCAVFGSSTVSLHPKGLSNSQVNCQVSLKPWQ